MDTLESALITAVVGTWGHFTRPFRGIDDKPEWRMKLASLPLPSRRYVIFFTPRSGSSRLTDLVDNAGNLSRPGECFNPRRLHTMAAYFGARDLPDYLDLLMRHRTTNGTFGCEITIEHLYAIFFTARRFLQLYQPTATIFLIRKNIVEQAVSLSRMTQTGFSHRVTAAAPAGADTCFHYHPYRIRRNILRIARMERQTERALSLCNLQPLRLSYETLVNNDPAISVSLIARHIGASPDQLDQLTSAHRKIGDDRSIEFARRFRAGHERFLATVARGRQQTLEALAAQENACFAEQWPQTLP
jgi:LPS sulfotransferase NodH